MNYMWDNNESTVSEIGHYVMLESSTLTPLLKKLEDKKYIERIRSKKDERNVIIRITDKGTSLQEKAKNIPKCVSNKLKISKEERKQLCQIIKKILTNLEGE